MNILFTTAIHGIGGGERNLLEIVQDFRKYHGFNCKVLLPCEGALSEELKLRDIPHTNFTKHCIFSRQWIKHLPLSYSFFYNIDRIVQEILNDFEHIDIVHSYSLHTLPLSKLLAQEFRASLVWTCHGYWEKPNLRARWLEKNVDAVVTITPEIYNMVKVVNKWLIPLGVDLCSYSQYLGENIKPCIKKILCVGRFQKIKGQDILVEAFKMIKELYGNVELHFYGDVITANKEDLDFKQYVIDLVKRYNLGDIVFFNGFDKKIKQKMIEYDILCIPSRYESFSITLLEGMLAGIPVVAPNVGGPNWIVSDGEDGLLFDAGNPRDLANKCLKILNHELVLEPNRIRDKAVKFSIRNQTMQLSKLYRSLLR